MSSAEPEETGAVVKNSAGTPGELRGRLKGCKDKVCTLEAVKFSVEKPGRDFPNIPKPATVVKISSFFCGFPYFRIYPSPWGRDYGISR